jgi:putative flippase GtrA
MDALIYRLMRCFFVSVGSTFMSALIIVVLAVGFGVPGGVANVVAVLVATGPSYYANRRWVWGRRERSDYLRQVAPFWALSITGLVCSTVAVAWTDSMTAGWPVAARAFVLPLANLSIYAVLWVAQFTLLDRFIFGGRPRSPAERDFDRPDAERRAAA